MLLRFCSSTRKYIPLLNGKEPQQQEANKNIKKKPQPTEPQNETTKNLQVKIQAKTPIKQCSSSIDTKETFTLITELM